MKYDFDQVTDRWNTNCMNTDGFRQYIFHDDGTMAFPYEDKEFIRMWIADMEFAAPDVVVEAIQERLKKPIFGYTRIFDPAYFGAFLAWTKKMYDWVPKREDLFGAPGVIPAMYELTSYICREDEKVLIFTPSYAHFKYAADHSGLECVTCSLVDREHNGYFEIDWDDLETKAKDPKVRLCIFCNPHNPTGRIWTEEELRKFAEICFANNVMILSDEIHCDLIRSHCRHTPLAKLFPDSDQIITAMAPSKTFNLAGLQVSDIVIPNEEVKAQWKMYHYFNENPLSLTAGQAAYEKGYDWLIQMREYLDANFVFVKEYLDRHLPKAVFRIPEATYLGWVDVSAYTDPEEHLPSLFAYGAGVLLEGGNMFVANSDGYIRLNLAMPRAMLAEGVKRICDLLNDPHRMKAPQVH